ncbi:gamma-glutamyl-gamma-aminobutyrate hydrolase family protein [Nonomuraea sp. NN258]|uniref:gamma-glutamyl-gamma-aminobutyrate hydrolase family protein n=1 Tax=Nonomuraea antri TaxID=2730852 RepID=UPI001568C518|nr:gamma-glutamyl-gamma-aminobutyrate hydrolase family protein [Nonomuraea antri]NRQ35233.1 gamma-glutamyl-gamma-aminobutyrate hydrolase family protein [Nonomuraea antri]
MSRPVIGITTYVEPAAFTVWELEVALLPSMYVEQVVRAGGQPVLLPPAGDPAAVVPRLDGLILAGGGDIDPRRYGAEPHRRTGFVRDFRDGAEFAALAAALDRGLPYLGICRGLQVMNVALGGTLHQHLPDVVGHQGHSPAPGAFGHLPITPVEGTRLAKVLGPGPVTVPHYHHQAVDRLAPELTVTATASDGTIEAVELDSHPFALAVQWHPEAAADGALFDALVAAC